MLLIGSFLPGCGGMGIKGNTETARDKVPVRKTDSTTGEHMTISMAIWSIADAIPDNTRDEVKERFENKLNITIRPYNVTWDDYDQKILIWAASEQLPDVFATNAINTPNFLNWVKQGIIHELPDDLSAYPDLNNLMQDKYSQAYKYPFAKNNGRFYCIPRLNYRDTNFWANDVGILIRKDWMLKVGFNDTPDNMEDFIKLMKAFVEKDPDGDGINDTIGLTCYSPSWLAYLMLGYEPSLAGATNNWVKVDGRWIPSFMTENCIAGVKAIKKLYDEGGLDRDFATVKADEGMDKFASGIAGAYAHNVLPSTMKSIEDRFERMFPDKNFADCITIMKPLKNLDGGYYRYTAPGSWSESYINARADDRKVDRILKMFDYALSEEGYNLIHYGIEGTDYRKKDGSIVTIEQKKPDGTLLSITEKYPFTRINYLAEWSGTKQYYSPTIPAPLRKLALDALDWNLKNAKPADTDLRFGFIDYPSKGDAVEKFEVDLVKAIVSEDAEKTWRSMINTYLRNGYSKVISDFNSKVKELGID
jgi:hypothetical protein